MQAIDRPFTQIINSTTQFVIPVFQRDYSWSEAQCEQLWKDIMRIAQTTTNAKHFLGSVVYISSDASSSSFTRWLLIDGQQRVTTLTLLLAALRDHIRDSGWQGGEDDPTARRIEAYFLKNVQEEGARQPKLVLRRHDQATLQALLNHEERPVLASERIQENYDFFLEHIADADPALVYRGIGRLVVVDVTLQHGIDNPQMIFESLNSTGIDLSQSDLIRNFILMRLPEKEQTRLYDKYWSKVEALFRGSDKIFDNFVRDYLALKTKASKQEKADEIYQAFRHTFDALEAELGGIEAVLSEMHRFARYHAAFSIGGGALPELTAALGHLRRLVDVPAMLVMRLWDCHERVGTLTAPEFVQAIKLVEGYIFRRAICGEQTRGYWQVFANLSYKIQDNAPLRSLKVELARLRESYRYPTDKEFQTALQERDLYGMRVCAYLLERLENANSQEVTDTSHYSIEHIMPQNENLLPAWQNMLGKEWQEIQKRWLHRLGNLTLTGYNSLYSDRPFEEKKTIPKGFADSAVRLNRFVREQAVWTPIEMERRGQFLAEQACKIWPALTVDPALVSAAQQMEMQELAKRRDVAKVVMTATAKALFEQLRQQIFGIDNSILELAESKSVSYHGPTFFLEILPRKHRLMLILPLDFNEVNDSSSLIQDASRWKFLFYAQHQGGVIVNIEKAEDIEKAMPIIRQAYAVGGE